MADNFETSPNGVSRAPAALAARGVSKIFAGKKVLDKVDIEVRAGEIRALLGANGSGKSTLVKILTGVYQPDGGTITIGAKTLESIASPHQANAHGIAVVHQEAPLIDTFTVAECIAQFRGYPTVGGRIQWSKLNRDVAALLDQFGVDVGPQRLAGRLSAAERALVAIIIALDRVKSGLKLLVLDEVTASLPRNQAEPYLDRITALARSGIGVLMVTHRLAELHGRASTVTLLRDGRTVLEGNADSIDDRQIVTEMMGAAVPTSAAHPAEKSKGILSNLWNIRGRNERRGIDKGKAALSCEDVSGFRLRGLTFQVGAGEIVGIAGLSEAGINELPLILNGTLARLSGNISINGQAIERHPAPRDLIHAGMTVLPSDRLQAGGIGTLSVANNVLLPDLIRYWHQPRRERHVLQRMLEGFDVRPPVPSTVFGKLSGGNQQKAILAKWLLMRPAVLVLDDPTNGVDPNARAKIFELLRDAAAENVGILIFSTEPEQLAGICDRVLILRNGTIVHQLSGAELRPETISQWCYA